MTPLHILLVDDKVPDPAFGAGFPRAYRLLLSLIQLGHTVSFFPTNRQSTVNLNIESLKKHNIYVCDDIKELRNIDLAIISRPHNVHYYLPVIKKCHATAKVIYDTEALWYRRYDMQLATTGRLPWWAYRYDEIGMARQVDLCFVVNHEEKHILESEGVKEVRVLAHALQPNTDGQSFRDRKDFLVVGGILEADSSNEDALWYYLEGAWEEVYESTFAALDVTGHKWTERLQYNNFRNVKLCGLVDNLLPLYQSHRVFVAATRFATGIPWKVHESMANGCPCVISDLLARQLGVRHDHEALVASNPTEFIEKSIRLYNDEDLWESVRNNAFTLIKRDCDVERFKEILATSIAELF